MQSKVSDVSAYIEEAPLERREALTKLRQLCLETLSGYDEVMEYGMPSYKKNGIGEVSFASQKNYISLYILKQDALDTNRALLQGISVGKGCIRYNRPDQIDFAVVKKLLVDTLTSKGPIC